MGTPDFAVPTLLEPVAHGHEVVASLYPRAAKPAGRGMKLQLSPRADYGDMAARIPVLTPKTLKTPEALEEFGAHNADAAVVVAYGMILRQAILDALQVRLFQPARLAAAALAGRRRTDQPGARRQQAMQRLADGRRSMDVGP